MADKDIKLSIGLTGADSVSSDLKKIGKDANNLQNQGQSPQAKIRELENLTEKVRVNEFAYYDLNAEMNRTGKASETFTAGVTQVGKSTRNSSQALLLFSQGFEDAAYGIRGVLNNIPGLVIALGGTPGLAGAISIAAVSLSAILPLFTETAEKAADMSDKINEIATNAGELETERFDQLADGIDNAAEAAAALKQNFTETEAASASLAAAGLEDSAKIATAQRNISELLGKQVNAYKELEAAANRAEEKRKLAAQQQIAAEQVKLELARQAVTESGDIVGQKKALADTEQANLVTLRAQLQVLRDQRDVLAKASEERATDDPGLQILGIINKKAIPRTPAADEAFKALNDPVFTAQIAALEARSDKLAGAVETLTKDGGIVEKAENAFVAAQTKLTDITSAVGINIQRIEQTLAADTLVARSEGLIASQQQQATTLSEALSKIETTNATAAQAKASIEAIVADGQITAAESDQLARASVQLIGQIQAGLATAGTNTQEILQIITQVVSQNVANKQQIEQLRKQVEAIQR